MISTVSPNHDQRENGVPLDMLVLHYTGMRSAEEAIERLTDPDSKVSAHYLIEQDGTLHQMVAEGRRAWHAGVAWWRGETNINARSIGIELVNPGHEFGYQPFPETQMEVLEELITDILSRHDIAARNIVGHSDVAPDRKTDPGELFDWQRLATKGIGLWATESDFLDMSPEMVSVNLANYGYTTESLSLAVKAFQRHFRPARVNGRIDAETARLLTGLIDNCE